MLVNSWVDEKTQEIGARIVTHNIYESLWFIDISQVDIRLQYALFSITDRLA